MKKNLFCAVILALSAVSSYGATVLTLDSEQLDISGGRYDVSSLGVGPANGYGNVSVTMVLDASAFQADVKKGGVDELLLEIWGPTNGSGVYLATDNKLAGIWNSSKPYSFDGGISNPDMLKNLFNAKEYASIAFTFEATSAGAYIYLSMVDMDGVVTTYAGKNTGLKGAGISTLQHLDYSSKYVDYLILDDSVLSQNDAFASNLAAIRAAAAVPEPGTATLGLFGLAGLMMRRRRKA